MLYVCQFQTCHRQEKLNRTFENHNIKNSSYRDTAKEGRMDHAQHTAQHADGVWWQEEGGEFWNGMESVCE